MILNMWIQKPMKLFYLNLKLITLMIMLGSHCFSMEIIKIHGGSRRDLFNNRTSTEYRQKINDHTDAINQVLADADRISARPATLKEKEIILKTVIAGALTDVTYDDKIGILSPYDSRKKRKHRNPYASDEIIENADESIKKHFTILKDMSSLALELIAYTNYYHIANIDAQTVELFGYEDLYNFSGLTTRALANWFNDILFGAISNPDTHNAGLMTLRQITMEPKRFDAHHFDVSYSKDDFSQKQTKNVAYRLFWALYHPDALFAAKFLQNDVSIVYTAGPIIRTTHDLQLAIEARQLVNDYADNPDDCEDPAAEKESYHSIFLSTVSRIANNPSNPDSLNALYTLFNEGDATTQDTAKRRLISIMKTKDHEHRFKAALFVLHFAATTLSDEDKDFAHQLLLRTDLEEDFWLDAMQLVLSKGNPEDSAMAKGLLASIPESDGWKFHSAQDILCRFKGNAGR